MERVRSRENRIRGLLGQTCPELYCFETVDSTNSFLKREALNGAPHGAAALADHQTAGRGRLGRTFLSPAGKGLYLSVLLRPDLPPEQLPPATGMAAVAVCRGVEAVCGAKLQIKWTNDLLLGGKKVCGILAETVLAPEGAALILGVGVNLTHDARDFGPELAQMAVSLGMEGYRVDREELAAALIRELYRLAEELGGDRSDWVREYRSRCVNPGREVRLLWTQGEERAVALDVDDAFGLVVRRRDGTVHTVRSGEVSVRGLYGYTE